MCVCDNDYCNVLISTDWCWPMKDGQYISKYNIRRDVGWKLVQLALQLGNVPNSWVDACILVSGKHFKLYKVWQQVIKHAAKHISCSVIRYRCFLLWVIVVRVVCFWHSTILPLPCIQSIVAAICRVLYHDKKVLPCNKQFAFFVLFTRKLYIYI